MSNISIFSILGPVMIGPSSSHTAGAVRIGKAAHSLANGNIRKVKFQLHGSFAKTGKGHGTDKALIAGILGMDTSDERIKDSYEIAEQKNIEISFEEKDLGDVHPNSVKIIVTPFDGDEITVSGSSIGGAEIIITSINGFDTEITGKYSALIIKHIDRSGVINSITNIIAHFDMNIVSMKNYREGKGDIAVTIIETDTTMANEIIKEILKLENVLDTAYIDSF